MKQEKYAVVDHVGTKAGMDYYSLQLAKSLSHYCKEVAVFSNFNAAQQALQFYSYFKGHQTSTFKKIWNHFWGFFKTALICRFKGYKHIVLHLFSYTYKDVYALFLFWILGIKVTAIVHDVEAFAGNNQAYLQKWILGFLSKRLMLHNAFSLKVLLEKFPDLAPKCKIIAHGNYLELYKHTISKTQARQALQLDTKQTYLLFFGQIKEVKGLDILLEAMTKVPKNIHLIIAGKPWKDDFNKYQSFIKTKQLSDQIHLDIGFIEDEKRSLYFAAADLLVLPYKKIFQSGVMLMAMSLKLPLLASNLEPMKELIQTGKNGFLFEGGNADDLAAQVNRIINAPQELLDNIAENAFQQVAQKHNWDRIAQALVHWDKTTHE